MSTLLRSRCLAVGVDIKPVFVCEFFASGLASSACEIGRSAGEKCVSGGFPAGSGVAEVADDECGFFAGVVRAADGAVLRSGCKRNFQS